jgi:putative transposase
LWAWLEQVYHRRPHEGLKGQTPIERWRSDLMRVRPLSPSLANKLDDIFCHRFERTVRKDATVSWEGIRFEVAHQYACEKIILVVNPHTKTALRIESLSGEHLGPVTLLNINSNLHRKRQRPYSESINLLKKTENAVALAHQQYTQHYALPISSFNEDK